MMNRGIQREERCERVCAKGVGGFVSGYINESVRVC